MSLVNQPITMRSCKIAATAQRSRAASVGEETEKHVALKSIGAA